MLVKRCFTPLICKGGPVDSPSLPHVPLHVLTQVKYDGAFLLLPCSHQSISYPARSAFSTVFLLLATPTCQASVLLVLSCVGQAAPCQVTALTRVPQRKGHCCWLQTTRPGYRGVCAEQAGVERVSFRILGYSWPKRFKDNTGVPTYIPTSEGRT